MLPKRFQAWKAGPEKKGIISEVVRLMDWKTSRRIFSKPTQARGRLTPWSASQSSSSSQSSQDQKGVV